MHTTAISAADAGRCHAVHFLFVSRHTLVHSGADLISPDDAVLLLKGFKDNLTPVRVNMATAAARCAFEGLVSEISESELIISVPLQLRVSCAMLVELGGARFEYGDTRKAPPSRRKELAEKFSSALTILLPDDTLIVVSELTT